MALYIKNGEVLTSEEIVVTKDGKQIIGPTREMILADGWKDFVLPPKLDPDTGEVVTAILTMILPEVRKTAESLPDSEAVKVKALYKTWASCIGKTVNMGEKLYYDEKLYKVRLQHTVQPNQPPAVETASLYEEINESSSGTADSPIPYNNNMRLEPGKYYSQKGLVYKCTRDSEIPVFQDLSGLVGIYVEKVEV